MHLAAVLAVATALCAAGAQAPPLLLPEAPSALPFAVTTPPPAWIEPGLRLTFRVLAGVNPSGDCEYQVDEHGHWVDAAGNRYKRVEAAGTGSAGWLQANVLAIDDRQVAVQMLFYLFDGLDESAPTERMEFGNLAAAGCGGDLWLHPQALDGLLQRGAPGLVVRAMDYRIEQVSYRALLLFWPRPAGRSVWIYDRDSGVLLYASDIQKGGARRAQTGEQLSAGGASVRFTTFKGSRTLQVPWARQPLPPAVQRAQGFDFRGRMRVEPVATDTPLPFALRYDVLQRGDDWLCARQVAADAVPGLDLRVRSSGQLGGLWLPPAAAAGLKVGQVLDRDPLVKTTVSVAYVDAEVVTICQQGPRQRFEFTYRKTDGLLVRGSFVEQLTATPGAPALRKAVDLELAGVR